MIRPRRRREPNSSGVQENVQSYPTSWQTLFDSQQTKRVIQTRFDRHISNSVVRVIFERVIVIVSVTNLQYSNRHFYVYKYSTQAYFALI